MKKSLLTLAIGFFMFTATAQLQVQPGVNWQQYLSNLMGGNCVSISNVTYQGPPNAFSYFQDSVSSFGISRGIAISTGNADPAMAFPSGYFASTAFNMPGDSDLQQIFINNGQFYQTFDAVKIEFDFTSPVNDTVFVDYVFGSEEYPEYVCSSFNDIFGFFVFDSTNGSTTNIAKIPGTNFPVAINTVNYGLNNIYGNGGGCTQDTLNYVNGTNSTLGFCFDGYTKPLTATFIAQAGVQYHLKIVIADAGDAIFDSGVFLQIQDGIQNVVGHVNYQGASAQGGVVELLGFNVDSTIANPIAATNIDPTGDFYFVNVPFASYIVRIALDTLLHPGAVPTYYDSAFLWSDADIVNLSCDSLAYGFSAFQLLQTTGPGTVSGTVFSGNGAFKNDTADGFASFVHLWLADAISKQPIAHTLTNAQGDYSFLNVPLGSYKLYVDVPVLTMDSVREVQVSAATLEALYQDYIVLPEIIRVYKRAEEVSALSTTNFDQLNLFPNPVKHSLQVSNNEVIERVAILDVQGRVLSHTYPQSKSAVISTTALASGIYFVQVTTVTGSAIRKIDVQR